MDVKQERICILGASGQVGSSLREIYPNAQVFDRHDFDLKSPKAYLHRLQEAGPQVVINAAAYTNVEQAEDEPELAFQINAEGPGELANWCSKNGVLLIHYSTDYVFNGSKSDPWSEEDLTDPLNVYGASKLEGEKRILAAGCAHLILRTSWVYSEHGHNFLKTMLRLGAERSELSIVDDQIGAPTYALHIAQATKDALHRWTPTKVGIYHLTSQGETSWCQFARSIFEQARTMGWEGSARTTHPLETSEFPTKAKRPLNSRLDTSRLNSKLKVQLPHWKDGLRECLRRLLN